MTSFHSIGNVVEHPKKGEKIKKQVFFLAISQKQCLFCGPKNRKRRPLWVCLTLGLRVEWGEHLVGRGRRRAAAGIIFTQNDTL